MLINPELWQPLGGLTLEESAEKAVKSSCSTLVTAGPGAGKTELLGQRGVFLLQTGLCPQPRRILAISFKRDAAKNLRERFQLRCCAEQISRFDSLTFDAFAKSLFDRFWRALPEPWKISKQYQLSVPGISKFEFADFQRSVVNALDFPDSIPIQIGRLVNFNPSEASVRGVGFDTFNLAIHNINLTTPVAISAADYLQYVYMRQMLLQETAFLSFPMIGRLLQFIIDTNPQIKTAILATYSHLFIDEFQDTTGVQYGLVKSIFKNSDTLITAVGDDKQQIMTWAGGQKDNFSMYERDFFNTDMPHGDQRIPLSVNYRSNQRIVDILNVLKQSLAPDEPDFRSVNPAPKLPPEAICSIIQSANNEEESVQLGVFLAQVIASGVPARSIGLLVKQKSSDWEQTLAPAFSRAGVLLRNEDRRVGGSSIQDLMTEPYPLAVLDFIDFLTRPRAGKLWPTLTSLLFDLNKLDADYDHDSMEKVNKSLSDFHNKYIIKDTSSPVDIKTLTDTINEIDNYLDLEKIKSTFPQYQYGDYLQTLQAAVHNFAEECAEKAADWRQMLELFRGEGHVPLLTITKSKGLEYNTVILLGLDDGQWWSFDRNPQEGHCNFFVAASRAKERLYMTILDGTKTQKIEAIYSLLHKAGVKTIRASNLQGIDIMPLPPPKVCH